MKIVVLGAGVIGITTAYYLSKAGHDVTVIERNAEAGMETSYANGGQLSYSYVAPLAGPGVVPKIPPWLLRRDSPLRFYPKFDIDQWRWCLAFLAACNRSQSEITTVHLLRLAYYSRDLIHHIIANEPIHFDYRRNGKLVIFSDNESFDGAKRTLDFQREHGSQQEAFTRQQVLDKEPALKHIAARISGGIYTPSEDAGDCHDFCVAMEKLLHNRNERSVKFMTNTSIDRIVAENGVVKSIITSRGDITADAYVMALGAANARVAKSLEFYLPIYPLKGYSLTLDTKTARNVAGVPGISVTDSKYKVVYALLGDELRVAGMADIAGHDRSLEADRVALLVAQAKATFPDAANYETNLKPWAGLRPATPKGTPIIGASPYKNLFLNTGHGALGWTLACACAAIVADVIDGKQAAISLEGFTLNG
jgi:D-amino-acid dehydrogenase